MSNKFLSFLNEHIIKRISFLPKGKRGNLITKNILFSYLFKAGQVISSLIIVPLSLEILTKTEYGIWLTIFSFVSWFNFFDIGLGHGLRNKLASALAKEDWNSGKEYVSTAYCTIIVIAGIFLLLILMANAFIDWNMILNVPTETKLPINFVMIVVFTAFSLKLVFKLITSIALAKQWPAIRDLHLFVSKAMILLALYLATFNPESSLLLYSIIYSLIPVFILLILSGILFKKEFEKIRPTIKRFRKNKVKEILSLGGNFFVIQISVAVLFMSDNLIISNILSPAEVTPYQIANKYFQVPMMGFAILVSPMWSAYTDAYEKGEMKWIKRSIKKFEKIWGLLILLIIVMAISSGYIIKIWLADKVAVSNLLIIGMALFALFSSLNSIYTHLLNGLSKIKLQKYTALSSIIINIPLSIYFAKHLNLGSAGVIFATNVSLLIYIITRKIQVKKIIKGTAEGIWGK